MTGLPQCAESINRLANQTGSLKEYEDLYIVLRNLSRDDLEVAVTQCNLLDIFSHMDLSDGNFSEAALNIAMIIFSTFRLIEFAHSHETELLKSIMSKNLPLRDFVISRLSDGVKNSPPEDIDIPETILLEISNIAIAEEITTASSARSFLMAFGEYHPNGVKILLNTSKRQDTFKEMTDQRVFDRLITIIKKNDPLLQLNVTAVLKLLLVCHKGRAFLQLSGVVDLLFSDLQNLQSNPFHDMLLPGYLNFFSSLAEEEPIAFLGNPNYRQPLAICLARYLSSSDPIITTSVIEAVGQICITINGKRKFAEYLKSGGCLSPLFTIAAAVMKNASSDFLPRILIALSDIINLPVAQDNLIDLIPVCELTQEWFGQLCAPDPQIRALKRIWDLAKQPFKEVRAASLKLLRSIATEPWGITMFAELPAFMEHLFNPTTEAGTAMDGSSLQPEKFRITEQCDRTQEIWKGVAPAWPLFDDLMAARVKKCVEEGIWGIRKVEAAVAMDNE
nr:26S proteasome non ATPase regulatory subunit 5 [Hymenolepis microstoma]